MSVSQRTFSKQDKLRILKEVKEHGVKITLDKHGLYPATYYSWKRKYKEMGEAGYRHGMTKERLKEMRRLENENLKLKEIVAEKELLIKMLVEKNVKMFGPWVRANAKEKTRGKKEASGPAMRRSCATTRITRDGH